MLFVGSPLETAQKDVVKCGKLLKKNNIAADVVILGEHEGNAEKLRAFVDAANSNDNSNLVAIPAGVVPSDVLISSPIIQGRSEGGDSGGAATGGGGGGGGGFGEFGARRRGTQSRSKSDEALPSTRVGEYRSRAVDAPRRAAAFQ